MEKSEVVLGICMEEARSTQGKIWNEWQNRFAHHEIKPFSFLCGETRKLDDAETQVS